MQLRKSATRRTAISASNAQTIIVRGHDLCAQLMGKISFTDHVWLLISGTLPSQEQRQVLDATLVAIAEHGLVPSVQASRMTFAAAPESLQGAVAAGLLGCGSVILGAAEAAGRFLAEVVAGANGQALEKSALAKVHEYREAGRQIPGYGHPQHKAIDPRAHKLIEIARDAHTDGPHIQAAFAVEALLPQVTGKQLKMNVSSAIPAVLLDAGYPLLALKGVPLLARAASLIAHLLEEQQRPIGFALSNAGAAAVEYDGPRPAGFEAERE